MSLSDADLDTLLGDLESDRVERKQSFKGDAPTKVREAVCAFANDLSDHRQPGVVFVGAADDGTPVAMPVNDELLLQLADIKTDGNIVPPPTLFVEKRVLRGVPMAVISVEPSDSPPVRFKGVIMPRLSESRARPRIQQAGAGAEERGRPAEGLSRSRATSASAGAGAIEGPDRRQGRADSRRGAGR